MPQKNVENGQEAKSQNTANYPRIIGGICEFCGVPAKECEHYKDVFYSGQFVCLCGGSRIQSTFNQSIYMYVPEWKAWICNSEGCRRQVELRGGFTKEEILRFYVP